SAQGSGRTGPSFLPTRVLPIAIESKEALPDATSRFRETSMTKSFRHIAASIGVIVIFQIAPALAADDADNFARLAQAAESAAPATMPSESKAPDASPPAGSVPS